MNVRQSINAAMAVFLFITIMTHTSAPQSNLLLATIACSLCVFTACVKR